MYLKSIEVHGFKSFANKIKFDFHNGITGIVGPNGSGKSNVADAVRWVLGEQRVKQLRGASMQDVIFSGTENRKPQSYASVSITLDNSDHQLTIDYDEVTITRRVYRSGESEYLLNGTACRLKDVNELFYDTGIGKEGYSIIGQGQIDRILSGKPEERRELFDEAAGIVKFKRRKSAAEKRLESEHANLLRVNDILSEVEKQLGPLERQSEVAKQFLKKRSELEENEIQSFLLEMDRIQQQLGSVEEKALIAQQDLNETNQQFESIREEYDKMEQELSLLEDGITLTRDKMNETSLLKGKLEGQIGVLQEQIKSANLNDAQYVERIASLNTQKDESFLQQSQYQNSKEEIQTFLNKVSSEQQQATARLLEIQQEILQYNQKIEQGKNEIMELLNNKASMKGKQQKYDTLLEQTNIRKAQLNQRLLQKHSDEEQMLTDLLEQESRLNQIEEQLLDQHAKAQDCESKTKEWNDKFQDTNRKLEQMSISFHREQSRYESLINIAERYDGYTNSIRKVMEKKEEEVGLVGVVADIIKVDKKYEQAIETALGGNIQNIVTTNEQTAKNMIQYLKEQKLGRATFLPLTTVTPKEDEKTQQALMEPGVIGRADSLILTDEKFRGVMEFLLCRVIVVDHIDSGLKLAKKYQYGLRIVTLEGESLNYGGSLTGGSFKNNSNLLGRGREIAQLEAGIKEKEQGIVEARNRLEEIQTAKEFLKKDKEDLRDQIAELEMEKRTIALALDRTRNQKDESDLLYANLALENQEIEVQIREIKNSKEQVRLDMEGAKSRNETITKQIEQWKEALEERIYLEEEQGKRVSSLQMEEASCSQKNGFMQENLDRILGEIKRLDGEIQAITENSLISQNDIVEKQLEITKLEEAIRSGDERQIELEVELKEAIARKEECTKRHKGFFEKREELTKRQSDLDKELFRLNGQREKLNETAENLSNHMWEEYEITLHQALSHRKNQDLSVGELKKRMIQLKDEIRRLGDVNINSIEEFKALLERYTFMNNQREDLLKAEDTLKEIIQDLDEGMRKQFKEKFVQIQNEFDLVFKELFGGGKGSLELMEGEDILECGIVIIAQPPGKKLQNMMQLSGGEKALTAIALLFAIQNMKPSPFCLLDEIEAALDDSNVTRFAKYLAKLTKNTQFIIITHRRGTMTAADRLYGITMQEKGVSALVSVNLIEKELEE